LVADLLAEAVEPVAPTAVAHARAEQLLERYGVLVREAALGEGVSGGFAGVYPVLKAMEERGQVRRGYFVAGLGGAQFAIPGAVDRLRAARPAAAATPPPDPDAPRMPWDPRPDETRGPAITVLAATDPAQPYGAALPWPELPAGGARPGRNAGAHVVLVDGLPVAYIERGGRSVVVLPAGAQRADDVAAGLRALVDRGRYRSLEIAKVDGSAARDSELAGPLRAEGFVDGYRGLVLRTRR